MIAALAVIALLASAFPATMEIDHLSQPTQSAASSADHVKNLEEGRIDLASSTECHAGYGCTPVIMSSDAQQLLEHFDSAQVFPGVLTYYPLGTRYRLFHPPRILSQV